MTAGEYVGVMAWNQTDFTLTCATSGVDHAVNVTTPFRYESLEAAPLILCLDGSWTAGTVRDATRIMSMSGEAPEAIVAGLSFTDTAMSDYLVSRARWLCPTQWVPPAETGVKNASAKDLGQATVYLDFIAEHVLPRLRADYRVSETWLVGHSFSALFGLHTLFSAPELFDKYLLASPSIWWHDRVMLDFEAEYAAKNDDLRARVFLTAGDFENESPFDIKANVGEISRRLAERSYPSLHVDHVILPEESHSSTIGAAVSSGLRHLSTSGAGD